MSDPQLSFKQLKKSLFLALLLPHFYMAPIIMNMFALVNLENTIQANLVCRDTDVSALVHLGDVKKKFG